MNDAQTIITIISSIASFLLVTLIPSIIALVKYIKNYKNAKTDAEKKAIYNDLLNEVNNLIAAAENTYKQIDSVLKSTTGKGSGEIKKEYVMTKLQAYCLEKGIEFDKDYWDKKVDEVVKLTKTVNSIN